MMCTEHCVYMGTWLLPVSQADHWMRWMMETLLSLLSQADHWMHWMMEASLTPVSWPDHWMRWTQTSKPKHNVELMYLLCSEFVFTREYCYTKVIYYYDYYFRVKRFTKLKLDTNIKISVFKGLTFTQTTHNLSGTGNGRWGGWVLWAAHPYHSNPQGPKGLSATTRAIDVKMVGTLPVWRNLCTSPASLSTAVWNKVTMTESRQQAVYEPLRPSEWSTIHYITNKNLVDHYDTLPLKFERDSRNNEAEWTKRTGNISGSRWSMQSYILTYSRIERKNLW